MKKIFSIFMMAVCLVFASCNSCHRSENDTMAYNVTGVDVEKAIMLDNEAMTVRFGECYNWLESQIDATNWIDETDTFDVKSVANIFSALIDSNTMMVYMYLHTQDTFICDSTKGLWVGDDPLNEYNPMTVNFAKAYDSMMKANCVKPHSRHCVLRKEVGPVSIEPLYVFGNQEAQVYVSTKDGKVTTENPVFPGGETDNDGSNDSILEALGYAFTW